MAHADRTERRLPLHALVLGAACLICCLPLLAGLGAGVSGLLATLGAAGLGAGFVLAAGAGVACQPPLISRSSLPDRPGCCWR
jgi:hypothetical protein